MATFCKQFDGDCMKNKWITFHWHEDSLAVEIAWTRTRDLDITKCAQRSGKWSVGCALWWNLAGVESCEEQLARQSQGARSLSQRVLFIKFRLLSSIKRQQCACMCVCCRMYGFQRVACGEIVQLSTVLLPLVIREEYTVANRSDSCAFWRLHFSGFLWVNFM
jgi:hypothetical protein